MASVLYFSLILLLVSSIKGCDDIEWKNTKTQYERCVKTTEERISAFKTFDQEICELMEKMIDCSAVLSPCMESHMSEAQAMLFAMPIDIQDWSHMMSKCQTPEFRFKRSAKKRGSGSTTSGRSRSGSIGRTVSRVASQSGISKAISRVTSRGSSSSSSSSRSHGGSKGLLKGLLGGGGSRGIASGSKPKKKSLFKRVGKYAVVGLAAYGTYKLAKKMSKGLRFEYDNDDCWQYTPYQDSYQCICNAQCNNYTGSAVSMGISYGLIFMTTMFSIIYHRIFSSINTV